MAAVINVNHFSVYLKHGMDCTVILPEAIDKEYKIPVLWLYHGSSGDHTVWLYNCPLVEYADKYNVAFVLPNVHQSCFVDMNIGDKYASYVGKELPTIIWNMFTCLDRNRENNYIAGYSNGGYGCLHIALKYPQRFSVVGAFSAGDKADAVFANDGSIKSKTRIQLYGDGDLHETEYGLTFQADKLIDEKSLGENVELPKIYHVCGELDPWVDMNRKLRDYFSSKEFTYEYVEIDDLGHEWELWRRALKDFLKKIFE